MKLLTQGGGLDDRLVCIRRSCGRRASAIVASAEQGSLDRGHGTRCLSTFLLWHCRVNACPAIRYDLHS